MAPALFGMDSGGRFQPIHRSPRTPSLQEGRADLCRDSLRLEGWLDHLPNLPDNLIPIDTSHMFCPDDWCPAIIGNVVAYRDDEHLTQTFARTLAPFFLASLDEEAPFLFD